MITGVIYITRHNGTKDIITFASVWQAEYYLHLIPIMQVDGNVEALKIYKARLGILVWYEA